MSEWLWGRRAVAEVLIGSNREVHSVCIETGASSPPLDAIVETAGRRGVEVEYLTSAEFARLDLAGAQRIAARCGAFRYKGEQDIPPAGSGGSSVLVILDHLEDLAYVNYISDPDEWLAYYERNAIHATEVGGKCGKGKAPAGFSQVWARTTSRDNNQTTKICVPVDAKGNPKPVDNVTPKDPVVCHLEDWKP